MIKIIFIVVMLPFIVIVVGTNNTYAQFDKYQERQESTAEVVNMTDKMKFLCIKIDASSAIDQMEDKEQQKQCEEFLDKVSIYKLKDLIERNIIEKQKKIID